MKSYLSLVHDVLLGVPMNISSAATLLALVAAVTGRTASRLTIFFADPHLYVTHLDAVREQLFREPRPRPSLIAAAPIPSPASFTIDDRVEWLEQILPNGVKLSGYDPHPALTAPLAV